MSNPNQTCAAVVVVVDCPHLLESKARCFKCSLRRPSIRFNNAESSDCCWERNFASFC